MVAIYRKCKILDEVYEVFENWDAAATYAYEMFREDDYDLYTLGKISWIRLLIYRMGSCA